MRKTISLIILVLLSINIITFSFYIQPAKSQPKTPTAPAYTPNWQNIETEPRPEFEFTDEKLMDIYVPRTLDLHSQEDLRRYAWCDKDSVELVVGVDVPKQQTQGLKELISKEGGQVTDSFSVDKTAKAIVVKVPINEAYNFAEKLRTNKLVKYVEADTMIKADLLPNDPNWTIQWGPHKIEADWAWNTTTGSSSILVAIIDTGIDYTHPDLASNYDPRGYDWINNDADPMDDYGHGTHVAGTVAAVINNHVGVVGVAQVRVMAEKVLNATGWGTDFTVAQGIYHATDAGAKIISISLGCYENTTVMYEAVKYAYNHGVLLVASAGNDHCEVKHYPAAYDEVIAATATDPDDDLAYFSNYGDWIELAAPGVDIYSTLPNNSYGFNSGTSMAAPHVTGVAALAWAVFPGFTRDQLRRHLQRTADDLGAFGFDKTFGYGRVNARIAVEGLPEHDVQVAEWKTILRIDPGKTAVLNATIFNYGKNNETNLSVRLLVNGSLFKSTVIDFLEEGETEVVNFQWATTICGNYNLTCEVVPVSGEVLTENNMASAFTYVRFSTILRVPADYPTVKDALSHAGSADTILISEGYYKEGALNIIAGQDYLTLAGEGNVTIDGLYQSDVLNVMANYATIKGLTIQNSYEWADDFGILVRGHGVTIINNTIQKNTRQIGVGGGIFVRDSDNNNITANRIVNNGYYGIHLLNSSNNVIDLNSIIANNERGILIGLGSNNTISRNYIADHAWLCGIQLVYSFNNTVTLNTVMNNSGGIVLGWKCEFTTVSLNNITANRGANLMVFGSENIISANDFVTLDSDSDDIELLDAANCTVSHNNFMRNPPKIYVKGQKINFWDGGYPAGGNYWCNYAGVDNFSGPYQNMTGSDSIGDTPFIISTNNTDNYPLMAPFKTFNALTWNNLRYNVNIVSNSSISGFNFDRQSCMLSFDVEGEDGTVGFSRMIITKDLMWCDNLDEWMVTVAAELIQRSIIEDDNFTYIYFTYAHSAKTIKIESTHVISIHDVAVTNITPSKTVIGKGYTLHLNVTVKNKGMFSESFEVAAYANSIPIETLPVTLNSCEQQIISFTWNTASWTEDSYTISAVAAQVPNESHTTDNTVQGGAIKVTIPGDVNGDFLVNIQDASLIGVNWQKTVPPTPPNVDINGDGIIDIKDASIIGVNWQKHA